MGLWMALGGIAGAAVGAYSQKGKKQEKQVIGALAGGGIGLLAGWWIPRQMQAVNSIGQVAGGAIAAGAPAAYQGARDAYAQLPSSGAGTKTATPSTQQLPGKAVSPAPSWEPTPGNSSSKSAGVTTGSQVSSLLDDAGIPSGEDESMMDLLQDNPFSSFMDSWTIE